VVDPVVDAIHAMAEQEGFTKKTGLYKKIYFGGLGWVPLKEVR
jgi:hypothetical protein